MKLNSKYNLLIEIKLILINDWTFVWEQRKLGELASIYDGVHKTPNYKDSGIISKGKTGILISDKAIYALKKNYIERILVSDLNSINVYGLGWCFNSNKKIELDNMSCSPELQGVILALICVLARECHAPGYKIKIHKWTKMLI